MGLKKKKNQILGIEFEGNSQIIINLFTIDERS